MAGCSNKQHKTASGTPSKPGCYVAEVTTRPSGIDEAGRRPLLPSACSRMHCDDEDHSMDPIPALERPVDGAIKGRVVRFQKWKWSRDQVAMRPTALTEDVNLYAQVLKVVGANLSHDERYKDELGACLPILMMLAT